MTEQNEILREVTITRLINAPRQRVWKAWTDSKLLVQWWGPRGFTNPICEVEAKAGGRILIHMSGFGMLAPMSGTFTEVVENKRLVFTNNAYFDAA